MIETIGVGLVAVTVLGRTWSIPYIGGYKSASPVQSRPYSVTRNSLCLFSIISAGGVGAKTGNLLVSVWSYDTCSLVFFHAIALEKRHASEVLGSDFAKYVQRVQRIFPHFAWFPD